MLGAEQVVLGLSKNATQFGYESVLAVTHDRGEEIPELYRLAKASGLTVYLLNCGSKFDPGAIMQLRRLARLHRVDILHCHGYRENLYARASLLGVKKVTTNHLWKRTTPSLRFYAKVDSWLIRGFDRVVAVSEEIRAELELLGLKAPQLAYVPNGVDAERFAPSATTQAERETTRAGLGLTEGDLVLAAISSLTPEKGHEYLLRAIAGLTDRYPNLRLLIVGSGPREHDLRLLASDLAVSHCTIFAGRREDIPQILSISDVYVLPSLAEGFSIALLEAMASGAACIATNVGDASRAIGAQDAGLLVPKADADRLAHAIEKLLQDKALRDLLGRNARKRVIDNFSVQEMTRSYCTLYDGIQVKA
jgi:glycosyltransferase involved in cell wall biosynthesis